MSRHRNRNRLVLVLILVVGAAFIVTPTRPTTTTSTTRGLQSPKTTVTDGHAPQNNGDHEGGDVAHVPDETHRPATTPHDEGGHDVEGRGAHGGQATVAPRLRIAMRGSAMTEAWLSSSDRLTFDTELRVAPSGGDLSHDDEFPAVKRDASTAKKLRVKCTTTFYGKSSIKVRYTKRRSVQVRTSTPVVLWPGAVPMDNFLLLSLWEDEYRLAYQSSLALLRTLGLMYAQSHLVELSCTGAQKVCGPFGGSLGAYLAIEYPSDAIVRRFTLLSPDHPAAGHLPLPHAADAVCPSGIPDAAPELHMTKSVEVGTRNWFYFERPPKYDLLHVPSFKRNSTLSDAYRAVERDPLGKAAASNAVRFHLDKYILWVAVNTLLHNGDYDDEVFFFQAGPVLSIMAWDYDTVFAPCHRKGKQALRSEMMFCAETPLEKKILQTPVLRDGYLRTMRCLLNTLGTPKAWAAAVRSAASELSAVLDAAPHVRDATFGSKAKSHGDPEIGVTELTKNFKAQHRALLGTLPSHHEDKADEKKQLAALHGDDEHDAVPAGRGGAKARHDKAQDDAEVLAVDAETKAPCVDADPKLQRAMKAAFKSEYKKEAVIQRSDITGLLDVRGVSSESIKLFTPRGKTLTFPEATGETLTEPGMYCASVRHNGCDVTRVVVVRSRERGTAEFGVGHYTVPLFPHLPLPASHHAPNDEPAPQHFGIDDSVAMAAAHAPQLSVQTPMLWPAGAAWPVWARLTTSGGKWHRTNAALRAVSSGDASEAAVPLVRGLSAAFIGRVPGAGHSLVSALPSSGKESELNLQATIGKYTTSAVFPLPRRVAMEDLRSTAVDLPATVHDHWSAETEMELKKRARVSAGEEVPDHVDCIVRVPSKGAVVNEGGKVTLHAGCILLVPRGAAITVHGGLELHGTRQSPVSVTVLPSKASKKTTDGDEDGNAAPQSSAVAAWDSIVVSGANAQVTMQWAFVSASGSGAPRKAETGHHHKRSAAVTVIDGARAAIEDSVLAGLEGPGFVAGQNGAVVFRRSVVQFAEMGGECVSCTFTADRSVFSHFATDYAAAYEDDDNDGLYLSGGTHVVSKSVIANTHDDGIDSGTPEKSRGDGGSLRVDGSIIERVFHEGIALSSSPKGKRTVKIAHTLVQHAQQGIENGYTGPDHTATVTASAVRFCKVGIRYGDNYHSRPQNGKLTVTGAWLAGNDDDVVNFVRQHHSPKVPASALSISASVMASPGHSPWPCVAVHSSFTGSGNTRPSSTRGRREGAMDAAAHQQAATVQAHARRLQDPVGLEDEDA